MGSPSHAWSYGYAHRLRYLLLLTAILSTESFLTASVARRHSARPVPPSRTLILYASAAETQSNKFQQDLVNTLGGGNRDFKQDPLQRWERPLLIKSDQDGVEKAMRMLKRMLQLDVATEESFRIVFEALVKRGRLIWVNPQGDFTSAATSMGLMLTELEGISGDVEISTSTYNLVLEGYANCANPREPIRYADRAEKLFQKMGSSVDSTSLSHVIRAWAWQQENRQNAKCAKRARDYLEQLKEHPDRDDDILVQAYGHVLEAMSKAKGGAGDAEQLFTERSLIGSTPVSTGDYTNVILAHAKDRFTEGSAKRATAYLKKMSSLYLDGELEDDPELIAYVSVIAAWSNEPTKAEEILWLMEKQVRPVVDSMVPDVYTYNSVCHAHVKENKRITTDSLKAVARIVKYMEDQGAGAQPRIKPDSYTYNTLIKAWNLSGNLQTVEQLEEILDRMESVLNGVGSVTNKNFNVVLNGYAKSRNPQASEKALHLLRKMKASTLVEPDTITYTTVLECLAKSNRDDAVPVALGLMAELQQQYEDDGHDRAMMPNARTFNAVIMALSKVPDQVFKARQLLEELVDLYEESNNDASLRPSIYVYNNVINCAANSETNLLDAFKIAAKTYRELTNAKHLKPDSFTYHFWFKACTKLLPKDSTLYPKFIMYSFTQCRKEGLVSKEVLTKLKFGHLDYEQLAELLKCEPNEVLSMTAKQLNPQWTRNCRY